MLKRMEGLAYYTNKALPPRSTGIVSHRLFSILRIYRYDDCDGAGVVALAILGTKHKARAVATETRRRRERCVGGCVDTVASTLTEASRR
jgi:hypothetical protein